MEKTIAWNVLELIKINNQAYHKFVTLHGLKRCYLHEWLQIEINYLQDFLEWYDTFELFFFFLFHWLVNLTYVLHTL